MMVQKSDILSVEGGGDRDKKVLVKGVLVNRYEPMSDREGMDALSMVESMVGRTCSRVVGP